MNGLEIILLVAGVALFVTGLIIWSQGVSIQKGEYDGTNEDELGA